MPNKKADALLGNLHTAKTSGAPPSTGALPKVHDANDVRQSSPSDVRGAKSRAA
jgi:hypothetical protein